MLMPEQSSIPQYSKSNGLWGNYHRLTESTFSSLLPPPSYDSLISPKNTVLRIEKIEFPQEDPTSIFLIKGPSELKNMHAKKNTPFGSMLSATKSFSDKYFEDKKHTAEKYWENTGKTMEASKLTATYPIVESRFDKIVEEPETVNVKMSVDSFKSERTASDIHRNKDCTSIDLWNPTFFTVDNKEGSKKFNHMDELMESNVEEYREQNFGREDYPMFECLTKNHERSLSFANHSTPSCALSLSMALHNHSNEVFGMETIQSSNSDFCKPKENQNYWRNEAKRRLEKENKSKTKQKYSKKDDKSEEIDPDTSARVLRKLEENRSFSSRQTFALQKEELQARNEEKRILHMEATQDGYSYKPYNSNQTVAVKTEIVGENKKYKGAIEKMGKKKKLKKSNGNEMKTSNWISWKTFKNLFRSDKKTSKDIQDGSEATVSETDGASSKSNKNKERKKVKEQKNLIEKDQNEKSDNYNDNTQEKLKNDYEKTDKTMRNDQENQARAATEKNPNNASSESYGHINQREIHGPSFEKESGLQNSLRFGLEDIDVEAALKKNSKMTDQGVFHLLYEMVGDYNTGKEESFQFGLIHPNFLNDYFDAHSTQSFTDAFSEYTSFVRAFKPQKLLMPVLRRDHFVLVVFGKDSENSRMIRVHVLDSSTGKRMISESEAEKIAHEYFGENIEDVFIERAEKEEAQKQAFDSNDCGVFTCHNAKRYLEANTESLRKLHYMMKLQDDDLIIDTSATRKANADILKSLKLAQDTYQENNVVPLTPAQHFSDLSDLPSEESKIDKTRNESNTLGDHLEVHGRSIRSNFTNKKTKGKFPKKFELRQRKTGRIQKVKPDENVIANITAETIAKEINKAITEVKDRDELKKLKSAKKILEEQMKNSSEPSSTSEEISCDSDFSPPKVSKYTPLRLTEKQKKFIIEKFDSKKISLDEIIRRFHFPASKKDAKCEIRRIRKEIRSQKTNQRHALELLNDRVVNMVKAAIDNNDEIHEDFIQRTGMNQAVCFGVKNFKASRNWVAGIKKRLNLVSRHIDRRIVKPKANSGPSEEEKVRKFLLTEIPRLKRKYAPSHIFNVDQTSVKYEMTKNRCLDVRGKKKVEKYAQRKNALSHSFTVNPCISAAGEIIGKTFITCSL